MKKGKQGASFKLKLKLQTLSNELQK